LLKLFEVALANRLMTIILVLLMIVLGLHAMKELPIDAVPDVTPNVVQVSTNAPGLGATEVEKFITFPVELAMRGLPGTKEIRSISRFGLSSVWIYFDEHLETYFVRQLVMERLSAAREAIPASFGNPAMTPVSTALGEIFKFEVVDRQRSLMDLRSILDWQIVPRLKEVPGVADVTSYGGELKTYEVQVQPETLVKYGLSLKDLFDALERNNGSAGGGYLLHNGEQEVIRASGLIGSLEDLGNIVVATRDGIPIYVHNLGKVAFAPRLRQGIVTRDGKGETVAGVVLLRIGENSRVVVGLVREKLQEIQKDLPPGVTIVPYYDRAELIQRTIDTVIHNLAEGACLVVLVLLLFLGNVRASLIVASVIPLSMLVAFIGMNGAGVSGNLMSLGAIDFGLIVDGSVVMIENIFRHLAREDNADAPMSHRVFTAGREVLRPIVFATVIIIIVYLPILSFQEVEGKMFRPMALTVIFALTGSLLCALTIVPVMASLFLRHVSTHEPWLARKCERISAKITAFVSMRPQKVIAVTGVIFAASILIAPFLGSEFIPTLDEGTINLDVLRVPSISLEGAVADSTKTEKALLEVPEVTHVVTRTGHPEMATDTDGPDEADVYVFLKPRSEWRFRDRDQLIDVLRAKLDEKVPETRFGFTQPIEARVNDMLAGVHADLAIHIYGDDMKRMFEVANQIMAIVNGIPGAANANIIPRTGLPTLNIEVDRSEVARYGINVDDVLDAVEAIGGRIVGQVVEGQARYMVQVRFAEPSRTTADNLQDIQVAGPGGVSIPLAQLAHFKEDYGPVAIWRDNLSRRLTVAVNVEHTDLGTFVSRARTEIAEKLELPRGWRLEWGGQYENLARASQRLLLLTPIALLLIVVLLYNMFTSMRMTMLVFGNVLIAASGGILALYARGLTFSITAGVGFITLSGVSVLNGVVLVSEIQRLFESGMPMEKALEIAGRERLRPILMASLVALFGFLPMALSHGSGAEVQRPLATVVIGGLLTSLPFTLYVLPILYGWLMREVEVSPPNGNASDAESHAHQRFVVEPIVRI
jgi:cobalt-zinc-cadmium resistance protein CzcA